MGAETKTLSELIDSLITTNLRCWFAQEQVMDKSLSPEEVAKAAIDAQQLNKRRNALMRAIDSITNNSENSPWSKTY
jgi:hypothetical protein